MSLSPIMQSSPIPVMLSNFKKNYINPLVQCSPSLEDDPLLQAELEPEAPDGDAYPLEEPSDSPAAQHWAAVLAETVCIPGCLCVFCIRRSQSDVGEDCTPTGPSPRPRRRLRRSLPTTDSIMEVLYPATYLGAPGLPDPPAYFLGDAPSYPALSNNTESTQAYPSQAVTRTPIIPNHPDPLAEAPPLTGVPYPEIASRRVSQVPANLALDPSAAGLGIDIMEESVPPPEYSRFDQSRPRFPAASDVLGPYPSVPVLTPVAR